MLLPREKRNISFQPFNGTDTSSESAKEEKRNSKSDNWLP